MPPTAIFSISPIERSRFDVGASEDDAMPAPSRKPRHAAKVAAIAAGLSRGALYTDSASVAPESMRGSTRAGVTTGAGVGAGGAARTGAGATCSGAGAWGGAGTLVRPRRIV